MTPVSMQAKEAERKQRREAKKNPAQRKKLRKDLGIPNLNPFKAQILQKVWHYNHEPGHPPTHTRTHLCNTTVVVKFLWMLT